MNNSEKRKRDIESLYQGSSKKQTPKKKKKTSNKTQKNKKTTRTLSRVSRKKKRKLRLWVWATLFFIGFLCLLFAGFKLVQWAQDNKSTSLQNEKIKEETKVKKIPASEKDEMINPPDDKDNDYWNYMKLPLMSVDFNELKKKNSDTVAFIKVNGTNINYPVVQTTDNKYYLTHSYDKSKNDAGWVFLDYRNDIHNLNQNTIIYAHGRYDTTMFGSLKNVFKNNWYKNTDNYVIHLSTPTYNSLWQVFSVYSIPTETYYLTSSFGTTESYQKFIDTMISRSKFNFNATVNTNDKILTLSTCYNKTEKVVLHAKLIKGQAR